MRRVTSFASLAAAFSALILFGSCNGFFPSSDEITSLSLSPTSAWILPTKTQQFTATAVFGNNTSGDVTSQVTWSSSATNIATIDGTGLATAVAIGNTTITAKSNNSSVTATAPMTVSNKTISSITVNPQNITLSLSAGQQQQYTASATFSDGSVGNVTSSAGWNSSAPSIATISASGLATPVSIGTTTISASLGGTAGTTSLMVTQ
ncbi:MAG TPA: Ig-like domain-containing protein [Candidatus Binatia bacterium]|nr:Ig-like domain-containing protein [Candidatus Binatia bacterium]